MTMDVLDKQNTSEKKKDVDVGGGGKFGADLKVRDFNAFF